jgi:hypothetical protein
MTTRVTLADFVATRLAEDEAMARAAVASVLREVGAESVTLRALASMYSDHPDYREEWAQDAQTRRAPTGRREVPATD